MIERRCNVEEWLNSLEDKTVVGFVNKSSQNLSLFSYIYNAFELLARLLEEWSSVTRLWVEKIWSSVTGSGYISIRQISVGRYLRILDTLVLVSGQRWKDLSRLGYCQSNCLNSWSWKVRTNTVHYIWNTNNWTVKIFPVQLKFWNGPLFPTYMYLSTQNQKVICRYCENKNNKVSGPLCCLIPRADTIHFAWSN